MNTKGNIIQTILAAIAMLVLVLDGKTAVAGAMEGTVLCLRVVIPSLFPFLVLSSTLTAGLSGKGLGALSPLLCRCGIPSGAEPLFLSGILGGYPAGAQLVGQAVQGRCLSKSQADRILGLCNQAGPAFFFGVVAGQFASPWTGALLWGIQIIAALLTGLLLGRSAPAQQVTDPEPLPFSRRFQSCIRSMALVCAWVILFRVLLTFLDRWLLWLLPTDLRILLSGLLELTNGCTALAGCESLTLRFVIAGVLLNLGGLCVTMQTASVAAQYSLSMGPYLVCKVLQTGFGAFLCALIGYVTAPREEFSQLILLISLLFLAAVLGAFFILKKAVAKKEKLVYNGSRNQRMRYI